MTGSARAALRPMLAADVPVLAAIFQAAIDELADEDYDEAQRSAWAASADDEAAFGTRLTGALTIVATLDGAPVGFATLEGNNLLDMIYVYPPRARQGVATLLCDAMEKLAAARGAQVLDVDASDTARPFFEARGFQPRHRETIELGGAWLGRTRMTKTLAG